MQNTLLEETIKRVTACYYSFDKTCILIGSVRWNEELAKRILFIEQELIYQNISSTEIAAALIALDSDIWINDNGVLSNALKANFSDFIQVKENQLDDIGDFYQELLAASRIRKATELLLLGSCAENCLKILLKSLEDTLRQESSGEFWPIVGEPREIYGIVENYVRNRPPNFERLE